jgi:hypothetical protein
MLAYTDTVHALWLIHRCHTRSSIFYLQVILGKGPIWQRRLAVLTRDTLSFSSFEGVQALFPAESHLDIDATRWVWAVAIGFDLDDSVLDDLIDAFGFAEPNVCAIWFHTVLIYSGQSSRSMTRIKMAHLIIGRSSNACGTWMWSHIRTVITHFSDLIFPPPANQCLYYDFVLSWQSTSPAWQMVNVDLPVLYLLCDVDGTKSLDYDEFQTFVSKVMIHGAMSQ